MKKLLLHSIALRFCELKKGITYSVLLLALLVTTKARGQAINESFEEPGWQVNSTANSTIVTITTTNTSQTESVNNGTWMRKTGTMLSAGATSNAHSGSIGAGFTSSGGFLVTPIIPGGVARVTGWMLATGTTTTVVVGVATNATVTANTGSISSTGANNAWSIASSVFGTGNGLINGAWASVQFTANVNNDARVKFQRLGNNYVLDDIVIYTAADDYFDLPTLATPATENFDDALGTSAAAVVPLGFRFNSGASPDWLTGSTASTTATAGTSGAGIFTSGSAGAIYNMANGVAASATDRAPGFLNSGSLSSPRSVLLKVKNNTGTTITDLDIAFDYEKYRSGSRAWDWTFFHGSSSSPATSAPAGDQHYDADANNTTVSNPPESVSKSVSLSGLSIADGDVYYLRWQLTGDGGSTNGQALGIDNISITPQAVVCNDVAISSATAAESPICAASTTLLTAHGVDGTNAEVNWFDAPGGGGSNVGGPYSGTGDVAGPTLGPGTYYARVTGDCGSPVEASVTVGLINTNTYSTTGNWSTDANWSCGYQPTSGQDVVIANSGHPTLDVDYTAAGSLTMQATSTLDIAPTKTLTVSGSADFASQLVTFKSNASGSGSFGNKTGTVTGDDNVTVERYIPSRRAWRMLTIPVTSATNDLNDAWMDGRPAIPNAAAAASEPAGYGTIVTGHAQPSNANGYDFINIPTGASSIRRYIGGDWPVSAAGTPSMSTKLNITDEGYMLFVRGDRTVTSGVGSTTLRPNGALKTGTKAYTLSATFVKLIGNPYASAIDFATVYGHNGTIAENRFWRWDANNGSNGGYVIVQDDGGGGYETVPNEGTTDITQIQSGQAVFLRGGTGGTFNISESDKVPAGTPVTVPVVFDITNAPGKLFTNMYFDNGVDGLKLIDGVQARFADGNSVDMDANDLDKISNFNENISLLRNGKALSVEAHPQVTGEDILYLSTEKLSVRNYAFKFTAKNMQSGLTAILQDNFLGKESDISTADNGLTTYNFTVTADAASAATDRFRIVFKGGTLPLTLTSAKAYSLNNGVQVDWKTVNENGIRNYEVEKSADGRSFGKAITVAATGAGAYGWYDVAPVKGNNYYRIKGIGTNGDATYSQVLMVNLNSGKSSFSIYPNPVKGGIVGLQFSNMEKGKYAMVVYNSAGQKVVSRDITHLGGSATEEINLGTMASGVYRVSLISTSGSAQNQTLVIQK